METYVIDQALVTTQSIWSSLMEGLIIFGALGFIVWNIKMSFDIID